MTTERFEWRWLAVALLHSVFFLELINTAAGIHKLLFTGEERVAVGTNLYAKVRTNRTRFESVTARASSRRHMILRMNGWFQRVHLFLP
jgi:hypothetical protein